jgi:DNA-directed RNA polymerase subunit RPC12/RpoP
MDRTTASKDALLVMTILCYEYKLKGNYMMISYKCSYHKIPSIFEEMASKMVWDCKKCKSRMIMPISYHCSKCKQISANQIKRAFKKSMSDPNYSMCRKRLTREFEEGIFNR